MQQDWASPTRIYPYRDGYRDRVAIRGRLGRQAQSLSGSSIRPARWSRTSASARARRARYAYEWTGRNAAGAILPEGKYKIVQRLKDTADNVKTATFYVTLSKKLIWSKSTITLNGARFLRLRRLRERFYQHSELGV